MVKIFDFPSQRLEKTFSEYRIANLGIFCNYNILLLLTICFVVLGSGEINHSGSGENRQFWSNENHQSGVASPQVVLFTRPAAGQPVSQ